MKIIIDHSVKNSIIEKITTLDSQINELVGKKSGLISSFCDEYSPEAELRVIKQNDDGTWSRLTITDNVEAVKTGFWKSVKVDRFSTKLETLKNKPKEIQE